MAAAAAGARAARAAAAHSPAPVEAAAGGAEHSRRKRTAAGKEGKTALVVSTCMRKAHAHTTGVCASGQGMHVCRRASAPLRPPPLWQRRLALARPPLSPTHVGVEGGVNVIERQHTPI